MTPATVFIVLIVIIIAIIIVAVILWIILNSNPPEQKGANTPEIPICTTNAECSNGMVCSNRRCVIIDSSPSFSQVNIVYCPIASKLPVVRRLKRDSPEESHLYLQILSSNSSMWTSCSRESCISSAMSYSSGKRELSVGAGTLMVNPEGCLAVGPSAPFSIERMGQGWIIRDQYGNMLGKWSETNIAGFNDDKHYPQICKNSGNFTRGILHIETTTTYGSDLFDDDSTIEKLEALTQRNLSSG